MFRVCKTAHSKTHLLLFSNRYAVRNVSFKVDPEEQDRWRFYRTEMSQLRRKCKEETEALRVEERKKQEAYDKKFSWEFRFADAYAYAAEVNEKQKAKLLAMSQEKREKRQENWEERKEMVESERIVTELNEKEGMERELEIAKSYITPENIEGILDEAMDNPIITNFAFPNVKVSGDGKGVKNFDEDGELILHEVIPDI